MNLNIPLLGWYIAAIVWALGMWLSWRVNQAIIEIDYRHRIDQDPAFGNVIYIYSFLTIVFWPLIQLVSMQRAFVYSDKKEEE
jgi:hypothetical protein